MSSLLDYELGDEPDETPVDSVEHPIVSTQSGHPAAGWIAGVLLVAAAGAGIYFAGAWRPRIPTTPPAPAARPSPSLAETAEPVPIPPLDESDATVRTLVRSLSENPSILAWLSTPGLIRNFTLVVQNIADGATPAGHLKMLGPLTPFRADERGPLASVRPESYARYTTIANAVASVDPAGAATLYSTLKPRIEDAYRELGSPDRSFDRTLERAIDALLSTPTPSGPVALVHKGIGYAYNDARLEDLTGAQKQLLRMGPGNVAIIKARLRDIAIAIGISPDRLPRN
jgi:hypothetical protein